MSGPPLALLARSAAVFTLVVLLAPLVVVMIISFTAAELFRFPPEGLSLRWYWAILDHPTFIEAFWISLKLATASSAIGTVLGTMAAIGIVRHDFRGRHGLLSFFMSPLMLPQLVLGIAFLMYFSRIGLASTFTGLFIAHVIITVPFVIRLVMVSLERVHRNIERAAAISGAPPLLVFRKITFWLILSGMFSGAAFSFIMSFDNVAVSLFLTGTRMVTLPVQIYAYLEYSDDPLRAAISTVVIVKLTLLLALLERLIGFSRVFTQAGT